MICSVPPFAAGKSRRKVKNCPGRKGGSGLPSSGTSKNEQMDEQASSITFLSTLNFRKPKRAATVLSATSRGLSPPTVKFKSSWFGKA